jgi:peptidoglycan/xylan/chitin deacetylase (PgdA/CDA1 family)
MKEKYVIVVMMVIFLLLIGRLYTDYSFEDQDNNYISLICNKEELEVFVTLENEIAYNQTNTPCMEESKTPDYVNLYPNLYASPKTQWEEIPKDQKVCYLTFDDGPSQNTLKVLEVLEEQQIKATFFVIGEEIECSEENMKILKDVAD